MAANEDGARDSPFDALLRQARTDPEAAAGLVLAYADLEEPARGGLVEVLLADAAEHAEVLALLLGAEPSPALAARIAAGLRGASPSGAARPSRGRRDRAFRWGDRDRGGAAIVRQLHGGFVEGVSVAWEEGEVRLETVPLGRADALSALRRALRVPQGSAEVSPRRATDHLAEGLWRVRRRRGSLPDTLRPVAGLLP